MFVVVEVKERERGRDWCSQAPSRGSSCPAAWGVEELSTAMAARLFIIVIASSGLWLNRLVPAYPLKS